MNLHPVLHSESQNLKCMMRFLGVNWQGVAQKAGRRGVEMRSQDGGGGGVKPLKLEGLVGPGGMAHFRCSKSC